MKIKVLELIDFLSYYDEEYIELSYIEEFFLPRIRGAEGVISAIRGCPRAFCSKAEFSRLTKRSRVTIDDWIDKGLVVMMGAKIDLTATLCKLMAAHRW